MKVVYSDGTEGNLSLDQCRNLYIKDRFTKKDWEALEFEMNRLNIIKFDDPFLRTFGAKMVSIEYVKEQIAIH